MLLEIAESTWGSANSCSVPTMEKMQVSTSAGATSGILMFQATRQPEAPSMRADS